MAFDWREYFNLAQFLANNAGSRINKEAAYRSAISRVYYAAYCHARNYARDKQGFSPSGSPQDHSRIRNHFKQRGRIDIASYLDDLRQRRNFCDYDDMVPTITNLLVPSFEQAQKIFDALK